MAEANYRRSHGREALARVMRAAYDDLIEFVTTDEFKAIMDEMTALSGNARRAFVQSVLLDPARSSA